MDIMDVESSWIIDQNKEKNDPIARKIFMCCVGILSVCGIALFSFFAVMDIYFGSIMECNHPSSTTRFPLPTWFLVSGILASCRILIMIGVCLDEWTFQIMNKYTMHLYLLEGTHTIWLFCWSIGGIVIIASYGYKTCELPSHTTALLSVHDYVIIRLFFMFCDVFSSCCSKCI